MLVMLDMSLINYLVMINYMLDLLLRFVQEPRVVKIDVVSTKMETSKI